MPLPWLRLIDGVIGAADIARWVRGRATPDDPESARGALEQRLTSAVVGALGEAFDRDRERLEIERRRLDDERIRAERAMRLEILRQAGDREIGRLRLISAMALASLLGSLLLVATTGGLAVGAHVALGIGWLLLILALAAALSGQSSVGRMLARGNDWTPRRETSISSRSSALEVCPREDLDSRREWAPRHFRHRSGTCPLALRCFARIPSVSGSRASPSAPAGPRSAGALT